MTPEPLTAYLVEDEPLCRADFRQILRDFPEIRLLGEADTLTAAESFLSREKVDLLFLDLSVGRENGLDLVENLPEKPMVIALTAHPQHAARGFSLDLVDYILKPVEGERLRRALKKARLRKVSARLGTDAETFVAEIDGLKTILQLDEILGAEAMGNYVVLHTTRGKAIKRATFKQVEKKLPSPLFLKIRRGRVVSRRSVQSWHRNSSGRLELVFIGQKKLTVSQTHAARIRKILDMESSA